MAVKNFHDFCEELLSSGFSLGGGQPKGIYCAIPGDWQETQPDSPIRWHTGDLETDPWEWRMRVLEERQDIAYAKVFFRASGYITRAWYPYFLAVRRGGFSFEEVYRQGRISRMAKALYDILAQRGETPLHQLKRLAGIERADQAKFEKALVDLQMGLFITLCGRAQKLDKFGLGYGWSSTVLTTVEDFWSKRGVALEAADAALACEKIQAQVLRLNPEADSKQIKRFIWG